MPEILTDDEIITSFGGTVSSTTLHALRKVESKLLAKLAERQEAFGYAVFDPMTGWYFGDKSRGGAVAVYAHPSAELAVLRAEVERLKGGLYEQGNHTRYEKQQAACLREQLTSEQAANAATQELLQKLIEYIGNLAEFDPTYPPETKPVNRAAELLMEALSLPADRSALDAYLVQYKLDAER